MLAILALYEEYCERTCDLERRFVNSIMVVSVGFGAGQMILPRLTLPASQASGGLIFNETKSRQIANLEVLYETEKKEKDLQLKDQSIEALNRERLLQTEQIQKAELIRNAIIIGAILLLLLLGVTYNRYLLKQRGRSAAAGAASRD